MSVVAIQRVFRCAQRRRKMTEMLNSFHPHNVLATVKSATMTSSAVVFKHPQDRYVVASVFALDSRGKGLTEAKQEVTTGLKGKKKRMSFTTSSPSDKSDSMTMLSFHRSGKAHDSATASKCDWVSPKIGLGENTCLMTNATPSSLLVFSVFEKHVFLGQACVEMKNVSGRLYSGEAVELKDLPLHTKGAIPVHDPEVGKDIVGMLPLTGNYNTGVLTISLKLPPLLRSMSGWVQRASSTFLHGGEFKRRWMILINNKLLCYQDPYTLNQTKGELDMTQIYHLSFDRKTQNIEIQFGAGGKNSWTIRWDEDEAEHLAAMWHRKFKRCVPDGFKFPDYANKVKRKGNSTL